MPELLDIVDELDLVIGKISRDKLYSSKPVPIHRIVHVMSFDKRNRLWLQKRSATVKYLPGYWSTSAGGHVLSGETYTGAGEREHVEELGREGQLIFKAKDFYEKDGIRKWLVTFESRDEGPFEHGPEVSETTAFELDQINKMIRDKGKFHPELVFLLQKYYFR